MTGQDAARWQAGYADTERRIQAWAWEQRDMPPPDCDYQLRVRLAAGDPERLGEVPGVELP